MFHNRLTNDKKLIIVALVLFLMFFLFFMIKLYDRSYIGNNEILPTTVAENASQQVPEELIEEKQIVNEDAPVTVYVDIKGAVVKPNVYQLDDSCRVLEAITLAGGFLEDADETKINLAARVEDEMVIYVPRIGEQVEMSGGSGMLAANEGDQLININTATSEQLETLPGIGASKAASIVSYREENGLFQSIDDLINVTGIGEKSFEKLKDKIKVR